LFPDSVKKEEAFFKTGISYFNLDQHKKAIKTFNHIISKYYPSYFAIESYFYLSRIYYKTNMYYRAISNLLELILICDNIDTKDLAYFNIAWIYIDNGLFEKAKKNFANISPKNRKKFKLKNLSTELKKHNLIKKKNPALAGSLAIIPGAGFLYCKRYQDAFVSFLVNTGLIFAAHESFDNNMNALGTVLAFTEFGFYAGNIFGSISSAHKYNKNAKKKFSSSLKSSHIPDISFDFKNRRVILSLNLKF
jgi:tetratricopeptide (TPR) repeat protein